MSIEGKKQQIKEIYKAFETETEEYRKEAACKKGCSYCCTDAGNIDLTTLEGLIIREKIRKMPRPRQVALKKLLDKDMLKRKKKQASACPFLMKNNACMIYEVRPFSCRRIYSVHQCNPDNPPILNRQVMTIAQQTIKALQQLDDTGYSGHISCILHMLESSQFLATYLAGEYKPEEVMIFGKTYKIVINRMML